MQMNLLPFNVTLLTLSDQDVKTMRPVKVLDIFDGFSKNFHSDGLFSIETFGKVGEEKRNRFFSYIDLRISVFHPVVYKALLDLKGLYGEIMSGKGYAKWNDEIKDFEKSDVLEGDTGFSFFVKHFKDLKFEERPSSRRLFNIRLVEKYRNNCFLDKVIVMPAGLRDYVIDSNGKPSEDEINLKYRQILSIANVLENVNVKTNDKYLDSARFNLQTKIHELYLYIINVMEGKSKLILGKWASRKIYNTTRNVITSYIPDTDELHGPRTVSNNQTVIGLYQYLRNIMPLAVKHVRDTYLSSVFIGPNSPAILVNKKTLKKELVSLDAEHYDEWMTYEGLEKVMARFGEENLRHEPLEIQGYYVGLIYKEPGQYKFVQDISELPEGKDPKHLFPITFAELLYLSVYKDSHTIPAFVTRYPVTGYGSIYPGYLYLKTTVKSEVRHELDDNWQVKSDSIAYEFPLFGEQFYNSMSPAASHLARLGADFDGDMCSCICVLTDESKEEIASALKKKDYYVGVNGKMTFNASNDVIDLVVANMTS